MARCRGGSRTGRGDDRGTTLAEMLVSVMLLGVIGTVTAATTISGSRTTAGTTTRTEVSGQALETIEVMSRRLRTAVRPSVSAPTAFTSAGNDAVTFFANNRTGTGPSRVTYAVVAGVLRETVVPATVTSGAYEWTSATPRTRVLLRGVSTTPAVFAYTDDATSCTGGCAMTLSGSPAAVAPADLPRITTVQVTLTVARTASGRSKPLTFTSRTGVVRNTAPLKAP